MIRGIAVLGRLNADDTIDLTDLDLDSPRGTTTDDLPAVYPADDSARSGREAGPQGYMSGTVGWPGGMT